MEKENVTRFFLFPDEISQAQFEKFILGYGFVLVASCKTDFPTDKPFSTIVERMEDIHETMEQAVAFWHQLDAWAENFNGKYDGHESQLDIEPEDVEAFLASLPPEGRVN